MAYQNISTPRIYLNVPEFLASSTGSSLDPVFRTLPVGSSAVTTPPVTTGVTLTNPYIAILGHNQTAIELLDSSSAVITYDDIINGTPSSCSEGFSIFGGDIPATITSDGSSFNAGSVLLGTFYDFPHSPDLKLSISYDYSGIKETTTKGGNTLTNAFYTKPPAWGNGLGAWELGGTAALAKSGRRIWSLSFSFLSDSSIWPDNAGLTNETATTDTNSSGSPDLTLLHDDTFFRVIHLTNGSIPFIFCSDGDNPRQDNLAIAKFDQKAFTFQQTAPGLYSVKCKIREVW